MDILFELILELLLEGSMEVSSNKKISKWIRYPLVLLLILFFGSVVGLIFFVGILSFSQNKLLSIFLIVVGLVMLIGTILKFKTLYYKKK